MTTMKEGFLKWTQPRDKSCQSMLDLLCVVVSFDFLLTNACTPKTFPFIFFVTLSLNE